MIRVNDKFDVAWEEGMTVHRLLEKLNFSFRMLAIRVNGVFVPRREWNTYPVQDGDDVKVLHMTAGG